MGRPRVDRVNSGRTRHFGLVIGPMCRILLQCIKAVVGPGLQSGHFRPMLGFATLAMLEETRKSLNFRPVARRRRHQSGVRMCNLRNRVRTARGAVGALQPVVQYAFNPEWKRYTQSKVSHYG